MDSRVAPLVGAWIEMRFICNICNVQTVAPLVGAWIEIKEAYEAIAEMWSLPSWERGLKFLLDSENSQFYIVAPLVGAWIEIYEENRSIKQRNVAPLVGAWIEIVCVRPRDLHA